MSAIGIEIKGSPLSTSIDVDQMRTRLTNMRDRIQQEIEGGNTSEKLADRLNKVDSQIERLDSLAGQKVSLTPERAKAELENGMRFLSEGMKFLQNQGDGGTQDAGRLGRWYDHLDSVYRTIDQQA